VSREIRLLVAALIVGICLPAVWYFVAAPLVAILTWFGPADMCDINCPDVDWVMRDFTIGSIAVYVIIVSLAFRWVFKGKPSD